MNGFRVVRVSNTGSVGWCFCQRVLPPFDSISPFFYSGPNDFNKQTVDPTFAWVAALTPFSNATREEVAEDGYTQIAWLGTMPGIQGSQNPIFTYDSPSSVDPSRTYTGTLSTWYGINADGEIDHGIGGFPFGNNIGIMGYSAWARYEGLPAADKNFYKDRHLTDTSIFNFYDYLIDGPNKKEWQNWQTYNLNLIQTFFSDRLGVEFVYDVQEYDDGQSRSLGDPVLSVDIRSNYLNYPWSYAEAVPNPDAGRAFVATGGRSGGNNSNITKRANVRGTVFGELRADDLLDKSLLTDIIGRHTFTGLYSKEIYDSENRNWVKWAVDQRYPEDVGTGVSGSGTGGELNSGRTVDVITYLSGDLRGRNTAAGLNLRPLTVIQSPLGSANISYFDSHWNAPEVDPAAYLLHSIPVGL